ncbi:DUF397 domain-containing protein [Actinomadura sp. NPDC048955]|uniref:DUF397 domain-containing protein n=1 Tax=Actinomadura luteofluorescens TaxID=46163 RepID=A0A7Y9JHP5_9ACTN|nr:MULTISPECIES: DUF397 domain-containing protein [Actinomadura]MCR3742593.1 protein of unknown function (DUF397) [Actinomadura glauciflava]NYD47589.1 hypothetical protein [Actinomadura luteofluorescens]
MVYRSTPRVVLNWRKSSASGGESQCVEVAASGPSVLVRDSRNPSAGFLALAPAQWQALLNTIQNGDLDGR